MSSCCASSSESLVSRIFSNLMNDLADSGVPQGSFDIMAFGIVTEKCWQYNSCRTVLLSLSTDYGHLRSHDWWAKTMSRNVIDASSSSMQKTTSLNIQYKNRPIQKGMVWSRADRIWADETLETNSWLKGRTTIFMLKLQVCPAISTLKHTFSSWMRSWTHDFEKVIILRSIPLTPFKQLNNKPRLCGL